MNKKSRENSRRSAWLCGAVAISIGLCLTDCNPRLAAQDSAAADSELEVVVVLEGLTNPCGVAVQPETGQVFVSESGQGRVVRVVDGSAEEVITGFTTAVETIDFPFAVGPLGIHFIEKDMLVVGTGGRSFGEDRLAIFKIPAVGQAAIKSDAQQYQRLMSSLDDSSRAGGDFISIAVTFDQAFATCRQTDGDGFVTTLPTKRFKAGKLRELISTSAATNVANPSAIALSPDGFIVVGIRGEISDSPTPSTLAFFDEATGGFKNSFETDLEDLVALAYSPQSARLYALDLSWNNPDQAGLFKLIGRQANTKCVKQLIVGLERPTAMAFNKEGELFVTVLGAADDAEDEARGKLLKITGLK